MTDLCSISDVQALTQITYGAGTKPTSTEVSGWITDMTSWVQEYSGYVFSEATATNEKHDGTGNEFFMTDHYPISSITALTVDDTAMTEGTDYWIEDPVGGLIECATTPLCRKDGDDVGRDNIVITYKYYLASIPKTVKDFAATAVALKCISAAQMAATNSGTLESYSDGDISIKYAKDDALASMLLKRYEELKKLLPMKKAMASGGII